MTRLRKIPYTLWGWTVFCTIALTTSLVILVLPGVERCSRLARKASRIIFRLGGAWPRVHGLENLPAEPCVVAANHESFADGILLCALLPSGFRLVIKREMRTVLLAGRMLSRIGAVFVEREQGKERIADVRTVLKAARSGQSLAIFPEGTFLPEPGLLPFRPGAFAAAAAGELPVVPVAIRGCRRLLPSGSWLFTPSTIEVRFLEPIRVTGGGRRSHQAEQLAQECRRAMQAALAQDRR
ncbi:MAG: 1-acyl-sn-glycerol-3-phosphate acyltransferase [Gammaproteobacteria bacterium]|nr:1-acyl-sn-glycerol-3-phosphate acyltransferase [Gammaproteobacteria bacterium]MYF59503.1 1-acyl-sn-glycerol-3-phosphate acyltransferase [Gammaproteobacteria bacterium]